MSRHHRLSPYACPLCTAALRCLLRSPADHFCFTCHVVVTVVDDHMGWVAVPAEHGWTTPPQLVPIERLATRT